MGPEVPRVAVALKTSRAAGEGWWVCLCLVPLHRLDFFRSHKKEEAV